MRRDDLRFAVAAREDGLRRVRRLTFRIGAAGLACSAAIAIAFSHLTGSAAASGEIPVWRRPGREQRPGKGHRAAGHRAAGHRAAGHRAAGRYPARRRLAAGPGAERGPGPGAGEGKSLGGS